MKQIVKYFGMATIVMMVMLGWLEPVAAQWPSDPSVNVPICTVTGAQRTWQMSPDGSGGAVIAWMDEREERDIYAQRVDALGYTRWTADGLPVCVVAGEQGIPVTVSDGLGGAIITWEDRRDGYSDIYAQRVDGSGAFQWAPGGIPICTADGFQGNPYVVADGAGGAIVFWWDKTGFTTDWNIYAQRVDGSGVIQWAARGVPICTVGGDQEAPVAVSDGTGGAIVAWRDERGDDSDIYAQKVDGSGVVQWTVDGIPVCTAAGGQPGSLLAPDGAGGAIFAWRDTRGADYDIYAQRVDASGAVQWDPDGVPISTAPDHQLEPRVVSDGVGGGIISWCSYRDGYADVYAQRVDASGGISWTPGGVPIAATATGQALWSEMVSDGAEGAIITWQDYRSFLTSYDIYAQRVNGSGVVQWAPNGVPISNATKGQNYPWLVPGGAGGAIIAWLDSRHTDTDIYAQNVSSDGSLGNPRLEILQDLLSGSLTPDHPWVQEGLVELSFEVMAVHANLTNVRFCSDPLQHGSLPKKIHGYLVEFLPREIGFLAQGHTAQVAAKVQIPVGQHEGDYSGYFRAACDEGYSDSVSAGLHVDALEDLDIEDYAGNLSANTMELTGVKGGVAVGMYNLANPNMWETNYDPFDGPANVDLSSLTYSSTDLIYPEEPGKPIPADSVNPNLSAVFALGSGEAAQNIVQVHIPTKDMCENCTYAGTITVEDAGAGVADEFALKVTIVKGKLAGDGFWGEEEAGANVLHWTDFGFGERGVDLYRSDNTGSFFKLNTSPLGGSSYVDGDVFPGVVYQYKLGLLLNNGREILLGPISVKALGNGPTSFALFQNFPNPFSRTTTITYGLPASGGEESQAANRPSHITLRIYDVSGRLMRVLVDGPREPGHYSVSWDGKDEAGRAVATGVYLYRLEGGDFRATRKMVAVR